MTPLRRTEYCVCVQAITCGVGGGEGVAFVTFASDRLQISPAILTATENYKSLLEVRQMSMEGSIYSSFAPFQSVVLFYSILLYSSRKRCQIVSRVLRSRHLISYTFLVKGEMLQNVSFLGAQHLTQTANRLHFKHQSEGHVGLYIGVCYSFTKSQCFDKILVKKEISNMNFHHNSSIGSHVVVRKQTDGQTWRDCCYSLRERA